MQRITDFVLSVLASVAAFFLSWPFWRQFEYWAESYTAWWIYFGVGFVFAIYVFYIMIGSLRMLFQHAADEAADNQALDKDTTVADRRQS